MTGSDQVKRFNISFLNRDVKLKGLFWPSPRATKLKMVRNIFNKEEMTKVVETFYTWFSLLLTVVFVGEKLL